MRSTVFESKNSHANPVVLVKYYAKSVVHTAVFTAAGFTKF